MATDMFIKFNKIIEGDSTDSKHQKWIEIEEATFVTKQTSGGASSAHGSLLAGRGDFENLKIVKHLDSASAAINVNCAKGTHFEEIIVEFCRPMGEKTTYMKFVLKDSVIQKIETAASSGDDAVPKETIEIRYLTMHWIYTPTDPTGGGKKGSDIKKGWCTRENKEVTP